MPIPEVEKIWVNDKLVPWREAKVHVLTHALHYGSGVFEGVRCYETADGPGVFRLTDHLLRLARSAKLYYMPLPYSIDELRRATVGVIRANRLTSCYIRPLVYRGYGEMGLYPLTTPVECVIAAWPWGAYLGEEALAHGIRAKVASILSLDHASLARSSKACGQYLNPLLAKVEVTNAGYDEAIIVNEHGHVTEGSAENIFVVRDGVATTPPPSDGVLEGITRDTVMRLLQSEGIPVEQHSVSRSDLIVADEVFITGTAAEIVPIREVDDREVGSGEPGPVTRRVQSRYAAAVRGADPEFAGWVEHLNT